MKIAYVVTCRTDRFSVNGPQTPRHRDVCRPATSAGIPVSSGDTPHGHQN